MTFYYCSTRSWGKRPQYSHINPPNIGAQGTHGRIVSKYSRSDASSDEMLTAAGAATGSCTGRGTCGAISEPMRAGMLRLGWPITEEMPRLMRWGESWQHPGQPLVKTGAGAPDLANTSSSFIAALISLYFLSFGRSSTCLLAFCIRQPQSKQLSKYSFFSLLQERMIRSEHKWYLDIENCCLLLVPTKLGQVFLELDLTCRDPR